VIKKATIITFTVLAVYGCKKEMSAPVSVVDNAAFETYKNSHFLETLWQLDPNTATLNGYHKYDSLLVIPNSKSRDALLTFTKRQMDSLAKYNPGTFSADNKIDYQMIQDYLDATQWDLQQEKAYEWNPDTYNVINTFAVILNGNYAPLAKRLRNFYQKMEFVPAYYKEAQKQIKNPVPELTALATGQLSGGISIFEKDFTDSLKKSGIPDAEQKQMLTRVQTSVTAINGFVTWLKALKTDHARNFRVGKAMYENKFKYHLQSAEKVQQLYNSAVDRKKEVHKEMAKLSIKLWPKYFGKKTIPADTLQLIAEVLDTLSGKHVKPDGFQDAISKEIPELTAFVRLKDLLTIDDVKPLVIRKEPSYMVGVVSASVSPPGPYDKNGNIYFNVGSLAGWPADKAESYLREYNQYTLQILCIHEAVPGHYIQSLYSEKSPSLIRSVLASDATVEGWAVYAEQMMLESGFGDNEPEMWLMWYKWHLRSVCNVILDHDVHAGAMTKEDAVKLMTHEAFQQPAEAEEKWKRLTLTSVQLSSYYSGYKEIMDLRDAYKKKMGDKYNLKEFNEKFLSFGGAPVKYISEAMLAKPADKKEDAK
jgi:uncharacterized protein (DUF885 family)